MSDLNPSAPLPTEAELRELEARRPEYAEIRRAERTIQRLRAEIKRLKANTRPTPDLEYGPGYTQR